MTWSQNYDPCHSWPLSTLVSALPVLTLFFVLLVCHARVWIAALCGLLMAVGLAVFVFGMPAPMVAGACGSGAAFGLAPLAWIIVASIFLYQVAVETGQFDVMKHSIAMLSPDKRLQLILVAFCFGAFLEGTGGGGAPVAITGAFLIGLGFDPFEAATLCLIANTAPVAWGAVGTPIRTLAGVSSLDEGTLSAMAGRILPPFSLVLPFWLVRSMVGWRETFEVWPALAVSGVSFAVTQFYWSNYQDTGLVDVVAALVSLLTTAAFLHVWRPRNILPISDREELTRSIGRWAVLRGWSPFLLASIFIFIGGLPQVAKYLAWNELKVPMPGLHQTVYRVPPVVPSPKPDDAIVDLNPLSPPGTAVFAGAVVSALLLGMTPVATLRLFARTCRQLLQALLAIVCMVGLAFVTRYSGMDTVLGLSLTRTGASYAFFGTLLGWLGVALTGTDAGSNALFGNLQRVTAERLGLNPYLMAAANSSGGVMGKMIDAQSIVIATSATHQLGREAALFKAVLKHSLALVTLVGLVVVAYAFLIPWIIPEPPVLQAPALQTPALQTPAH